MKTLAFLAPCLVALSKSNRFVAPNDNVSLYPACQARYSTPCSFSNAFRVVNSVIKAIDNNSSTLISSVNNGQFNAPDGFDFNPYVLDSAFNVIANGYSADHNAKSLDELALSLVPIIQTDLTNRVSAASGQDGWFEFLWLHPGETTPSRRVGYVGKTLNALRNNETNYVFTSFTNRVLPTTDHCSASKNGKCSLTNARALVGLGLTQLALAPDSASIDIALGQLTYDPGFKLPGGFYVFVYQYGNSTNGECVSHGANPKFVGLNLTEILNFVGNTFVDGEVLHDQFVAAAEKGGEWVDYKWANQIGADPFEKIAFVVGLERFGTQYYLGVGFTHQIREYSKGAHCSTCSSAYSTPCTITNTYSLLSHTEAQLLTDVAEETVFSDITSKPEFHLDKGFYVFIYDFTGPNVAHGSRSDFVGLTLKGILEKVGNKWVDGELLHDKFVAAANQGGGWVRYAWRNNLETPIFDKVAYIIKVSKFGKEYYAGVGYSLITPPVIGNCSVEYAGACSEDNTLGVVGRIAAEIGVAQNSSELESIFHQASLGENGSFVTNFGYQPMVIAANRTVVGGVSGTGLDLSAYLTMQNVTSLTGDGFFGLIKAKGDEDGGGWIRYVWATVETLWEVSAYVLSAHYHVIGSVEAIQTFYIISGFKIAPAPRKCEAGCPANATCVERTAGLFLCECDLYHKVKFAELVDSCSIHQDQQMSCEFSEDLLPPDEDRQYDDGIKVFGTVLFILNLSFSCCLVGWTLKNKDHAVIRASQIQFLLCIALGAIISSSAILPLTVDDSGDTDGSALNMEFERANTACMLSIWLYTVGFVCSLAPLFAKMWRVSKLFHNKTLRKITISNKQLFKIILGLLAVDLAIVTNWTIAAPLKYEREILQHDKDGHPLLSAGLCKNEDSIPFMVALGCFHLSILLYGNVLSYKSRNIDDKFSEGKYVSVALVSNLQILIVAVPLLVIVSDNPKLNMFLRSGVIFLNDFSVLCFIFVPKIAAVRATRSSEITPTTDALVDTADDIAIKK